jgi:GH24 family phage-related lysozyme (muramidase)
MTDPRKPYADALRALGLDFNRAGVVAAFVELLDKAGIPREEAGDRAVSPKGIALMHKWEGCELEAYPDPGSKDGKPWTIGWGSTGGVIGPNTVWTQEQADDRFERDLVKYAAEVSKAIGPAPTTQEQFDALVAFHYNTGKIGTATLTKKHIAGDYEGAAREFGRWVFNDHKRMKGLVNRRADEEKLYRGEA